MSIKFFYNICLKDDRIDTLSGDILSGVRRGYFNGFERIRDRITINSDSDCLTYEYAIEKDKPARWSVKSADGTVLQENMPSDSGRYFIYYYEEQALYKRLLFSRLHTLLRVEYFDLTSGIPVVSLEPRKAPGGLCILYSSRTLPQPEVLYAAPSLSDDRVKAQMEREFFDYTAAASTDEGVVWFLTDEQAALYREKAAQIEDELASQTEQSYIGDHTPLRDKLNAKDFNVRRNLASALDITRAAEFSFVSAPGAEPEETELPASEDHSVAESPEDVQEERSAEEAVDAVASQDDLSYKSESADDVLNEPQVEQPVEPEDQSDESDSDEPSTAADEALGDSDAAPDAVTACKPDKLIAADGAMYRYYGELDENGDRSGFGRTVTDEGRTAYEGGYLRDKRWGTGSYFYKDGSLCYTGEWVENARHGVGVGVSSQDGSIHVGRWALNKPVGSGVRLTSQGDIRFVCKELSDGTTVLMNYMPDDTVIAAKYDEKGMKLGEERFSLKDFIK